ncbi:hypothetical protein [Antarcticirhabdus aurantiaca]|uniref:hypothetical protein n=1 Tax=Antarcticirhabdus aurantiaca TaxID=2606717 RepID=UPI00131C96A8|nr:hypothetical protein [Antarcticirhabdus aurantiaca]
MTVETIIVQVPKWVVVALHHAAGAAPVQAALGFGLRVALNVAPGVRRVLADQLLEPGVSERVDLAVHLSGAAAWPADDMPIAEVVELAAMLSAIVAVDPAVEIDIALLLHVEDA